MNPPATLLFIRHAATDLAGTFCGSADPPLNPLGRAQVESLVQSLAGERIAVVYTSDLERARQTAGPIASAHSAGLEVRPGLRELHFGDWETLTWQQIEQRDPAYAARWVAEFPTLPAPAGERIEVFRARIVQELQTLGTLAVPGNTVAVITHAGPLRVLLEEYGHFAAQHAWERTRDYTTVIRCSKTSTNTFIVEP